MAYLEPASSAICNESSTRPDRISGRPIVQLTSAASISHHIYPEAQSFTSDGSQTVFWRKRGPNGQPDLFMADLQHRTVRALTDEGAKGLGACIGPAVSPDEQWLYYVLARHDGNEMRRVSLKTLQRETLWDLPPGKPYVLGTISPDGRYYVTGFVEQNQPARVARVDLDTGDVRVIYSSPAVYNPHPVWDPSGSGWLLVQENTGYECGPHGHRLVDGLGARLLVMRADGSDVRQLSVGRRHDEWIQGHQTWLGRRGEVVATVVRQPSGGGRWRTDVIFALTPEGGRRVIAAGHPFWHIGADSVGRWIVCDTCLGGHIYLVDADDGRCHFVCASEASLGAAQCSHPHPAISPDGRWIVFNSDRTGIAQLYAVYVGDITGSG